MWSPIGCSPESLASMLVKYFKAAAQAFPSALPLCSTIEFITPARKKWVNTLIPRWIVCQIEILSLLPNY
jgi:hypothetical protein